MDRGIMSIWARDITVRADPDPSTGLLRYENIRSYECRAIQFENKIRKKLYNPNTPGFNEQRTIRTTNESRNSVIRLVIPTNYLEE
jgi:hypothetical protein